MEPKGYEFPKTTEYESPEPKEYEFPKPKEYEFPEPKAYEFPESSQSPKVLNEPTFLGGRFSSYSSSGIFFH